MKIVVMNPTCNFRWAECVEGKCVVRLNDGYGLGFRYAVLQQEWSCSDGTSEWREIPLDPSGLKARKA